MTKAFDEAQALLASKDVLTDEEIDALEAQYGKLTDEERMWLSGEIYARLNSGRAKVTMEQYVEAAKILDTADPDSPEYKKAEAIVTAFETSA